MADQLSSAAARGDSEQLRRLLQKEGREPVNSTNRFGRTALQVMKLGAPEIARILLENGADPNLKDPTGFAALHDAARAGFVDTVQTLVDFEADVNLEDGEGNLPLHLAAMEGHVAVVAYLLGHTGSKVDHLNKRGLTAYGLARLYKRLELLRWMDANCGRRQQQQQH
ncbi:cyclin-dependent kinase 4 inhibitor C-like [Cavia porcellus]|uniref:cyclin-dependent kinase 4 inhibitor C-like n=1 Tax=Cavia porcellus TaxID=10141 RepID=UPI002FE1A13D